MQQTFFLYVYEPGGNRVEVANAGARLVLAPDWKPIVWTEAERRKGQAWGLKTIESFHTHGTPPLPGEPLIASIRPEDGLDVSARNTAALSGGNGMKSRILISAAALAVATATALARDDVTIGMILPMTGPSASTGKQEKAGAELYIAEHGATVAGKTIKLEIKDDTGAADVTKRLAQELVANDHAAALMGFGLTPLALAAAPIATEAKVPEIVTAAATAMITEKSPYIVRTSFTLPQASAPMADWSLKNGIKKVVTHRHRLRPGHRCGEMVRRNLQEGRRRDRRGDPRAAEEPGFRARSCSA